MDIRNQNRLIHDAAFTGAASMLAILTMPHTPETLPRVYYEIIYAAIENYEEKAIRERYRLLGIPEPKHTSSEPA